MGSLFCCFPKIGQQKKSLMNDMQEETGMSDTFEIDDANSDEERLYVDVTGIATVCIEIADDGGVNVEVYPASVLVAPVAQCRATVTDLKGD